MSPSVWSNTEHLPSYALLAHQIRTPLTVIQGHTHLMRRRVKQCGAAEAAALERSLAAIELAVQETVSVVDEVVRQENARYARGWFRSLIFLATRPHIRHYPSLLSVVGRQLRDKVR